MSRADELRAEMAVVELEEQLIAAKAAGEVPRELKEALREARRSWRTLRSGEPDEGGAVVTPDPVTVTATVTDV